MSTPPVSSSSLFLGSPTSAFAVVGKILSVVVGRNGPRVGFGRFGGVGPSVAGTGLRVGLVGRPGTGRLVGLVGRPGLLGCDGLVAGGRGVVGRADGSLGRKVGRGVFFGLDVAGS